MRRPIVIVVLGIVIAVSVLGWWLVSCYPTYKSVPRLVRELRDENPNIRKQAAAELGLMGEDAKDAAPALIEALNDQVLFVRVTVADALGRIATEPGVVPALASALDKEDSFTKIILLHSLSMAGPQSEVIAAFINTLEDNDDSVCGWALKWLRDFGPDASEAIPKLIEKFNDQDYSLRVEILNTLVAMGTEPEIIDILIDSIDDENQEVRIACITHLGNFGNASRAAVPLLIDIINDETADDQLRAQTIVSLGKIGPEPGVVGAVLYAVWDDALQVYKAAFDSLGKLGDDPKAIDALIEILQSDDPERPMLAAYALGRIGPKAKEAVPFLIEMTDDERIYFRSAIMNALGDINPTADIVPTLMEGLRDDARDVRRSAAKATCKVGPAAGDAAALLVEMLDDGPWVGLEAARALNRIDTDYYETTIPVLIGLLAGQDNSLQSLAALELAYLGPVASDALPELKNILSGANLKRSRGDFDTPPSGFESRIGGVPYSRMFVACAYATARIDPGNERALYILIQGIGDNYLEIRIPSIDALGELGMQAKPALPHLEKITGDYSISPGVREAAEIAIDRINADDSTPLPE